MNAYTALPLAWRNAWVVVGWLGVALDVWLSLKSTPPPAGVVHGFDAAHGVSYLLLMFWFAQLYHGRARALAALALVALGVVLEILQGFNPNREMSYTDMRDNAVGVLAGWLLATTPLRMLLPALDARLAALTRRIGLR